MNGKKGLAVGTVVLGLSLLSSLGYIAYDKYINDDKIKCNCNKQDNELLNDGSYSYKDYKILEQGKNLLQKYMPSGDFNCSNKPGSELIVKNDTTQFNNLDNDIVLNITLNYLLNIKTNNLPSGDEVTYNENKNEDWENGISSIPSIIINKDFFEKVFIELWGSDKEIKYEEFYYYTNKVIINDNKIELYPFNGGGLCSPETTFVEPDKIYKEGKKLVIVVDYLDFIEEANGKYGLYNDPLHKNKLETFDSDEYNINNIYDKYKVSAGKYEIIFEQDKEENYFWSSSNKLDK